MKMLFLTLNKLLILTQQTLLIKTESVLKLLLIIQEKPLHLIGIKQDYQFFFKVDKLANAAALAATDHNGIVNGSNSFIKNLKMTANGREAYSCNYANHCVIIKILLEYNPSYAKSIDTNEFYFLDITRSADEIKYNI